MTSPMMRCKKCGKAATCRVTLRFEPGGEEQLNLCPFHIWDFYRSVAQWLSGPQRRHKLRRHRQS